MTESNDRQRRDGTVTADADGGYNYEADEDERLSEAVISSVAAVLGVEPTELDPLYETIDPDGLDQLFGSTIRGQSRAEARIEFTYANCDVTVLSSGRVIVEPLD